MSQSTEHLSVIPTGDDKKHEEQAREQLFALQAKVADAMLKSDDGWEIIHSLHNIIGQKILGTSAFVVPVLQHKTAILASLNDPQGFERSFATLTGDIAGYNTRLAALYAQHSERHGKPADHEHILVMQLSNAYNTLLDDLERVMEPLIFNLIDTVRDEFGSAFIGTGSVQETTNVSV